jgi:hypothetical protein
MRQKKIQLRRGAMLEAPNQPRRLLKVANALTDASDAAGDPSLRSKIAG